MRPPRFDYIWFAKLLEDHKNGDQQHAMDAAKYLSSYMGGNGGNGNSAQTVVAGGQKAGGSVERAIPGRIAERFAPSETTIRASSRCPWDLWMAGPDIAVKDNPDTPTTVGTVVSVDAGRMAQPAQPTSTTPSQRRVPIGVVHERIGRWLRVRTCGPTRVRIDSDTWQQNYYYGLQGELWLSEKYDGCASSRMPLTARNDIALIGRKIGTARGGMVEAYIQPPIYPARRYPVWEYDADNYIDVEVIEGYRGRFERMVFWVNGTIFAHLTDDGVMHLDGTLQTNPYGSDDNNTASLSRNGEIEYNTKGNSEISFAVYDGSNYVCVAEMIPGGTFRVGGFANLSYPLSYANSPNFTDAYNYDSTDTATYFRLETRRAYMGFNRYATSPCNARFECFGVQTDAFN